MGILTASPSVYYYRSKYLEEVEIQYHALKKRFAEHPELEVADSEDANKNFGNSKYTDDLFDNDEDVA